MENKIKTTFGYFLSCFPLAVLIICLFIYHSNDTSHFIEEIGSSLNDYPLLGLEYSGNCGYKYSGNVYNFPGSKLGCSCTAIKNYRRKQTGKYHVNVGKCSRNQTLNGCSEVPIVKPMLIKSWKQGMFCSKRYAKNEPGYFELLKNSVKENETCQIGYKKCAKLDSMGNYLCIPNIEECPINNIIVSNTKLLNLTNYRFSYFNQKYVYYTNNAPNKTIITKLKAAEGKVCIDGTYFYTDYPQYILDNNFKRYGCRTKLNGSLYDDVQIIDTWFKEELYQPLNLLSRYRVLDEFPFQSLAAKMILYPKHYIGLDKECFLANNITEESFSKSFFILIQEKINDIKKDNFDTIWFAIIGIVGNILCSYAFKYERIRISIFIAVYNILAIICYLGMGIPTYTNYNAISSLKRFPYCGDFVVNSRLKVVNEAEDFLTEKLFLILIIINCQILFLIIAVLELYFCPNKFFGDNEINYNDFDWNARMPLLGDNH